MTDVPTSPAPATAAASPIEGRVGFHSTSTAPHWEDGIPVGTGSLGLLVHGDAHEHVFDLTHEEGFVPLNPRPEAPEIAPVLDEVRELVLAGDGTAAAALVERTAQASGIDGLVWTDPFLPIAQLRWRTTPRGEVREYRRTVSFASGLVRLSWRDESGEHSVEVLPDRATSTIRVRLGGPDGVRGTLGVTRGQVREGQGEFTDADDYAPLVHSEITVEDGAIVARTRPVQEHRDAPGWEAVGRVRFDPSVTAATGVGANVTIDSTASVVDLVVDAQLPQRTARAVLGDDGAPHGELFTRSALDLSVSADDRSVPAEVLLARSREGDAAAERALVELAFAAGRHTIISSTGELPPNLVGAWQGTWAPAWSGDYTINGNVQNGTVASLVSTGTPELLLSLFRLIDRFPDDYRDNARRVFGAEGFQLPARMSTHGRANHFDTDYPHEFWIGAGVWMLRLGYDAFAATGDRRFLEEWLWPFAVEVLRFPDTALVDGDTDGRLRDGRLHVVPSYSPENTPAGADIPLSVDATSDVAALRDGYLVGARLAEAVGEPALAEQWLARRALLPEYRIAADGTLAEWIAPGVQEQHAHRHSSQLHALWYEGEERFDDAALRAAAQRLIETKLAWREEDPTGPPGHMEMAFGLEQLGVAAAHLGDGDLAARALGWLAREHWRPSMMTTHDAGAIFNADASGGLPAIVAEMLVQTTPAEVRLLPALPTSWTSGAVRGLRGRGGLVMDELRWSSDGVLAVLRRSPDSSAARDGDHLRVIPPRGFTAVDAADTVVLGEQPLRIEFRPTAR